jgi:hypothetical protein
MSSSSSTIIARQHHILHDDSPSHQPLEQCIQTQPLSPVPESSSEDEDELSSSSSSSSSMPETGQFSDALEEITIGDGDIGSPKLEINFKRDSKLEDDFNEAIDQLFAPPQPNSDNAMTATEEKKSSSSPGELESGAVVGEGKEPTQIPTEVEEKERNKPQQQGTAVLSLLIAGLCLAVLLVSLDRTIITTVSPSTFASGKK